MKKKSARKSPAKPALRARLNQIRRNDPRFSLDQFVKRANALLKNYAPRFRSEDGDARIKGELTARNLRSYQNRGLVDPPARAGKNALYGYLQLLQVLAIRRVLATGVRGPRLKALVEGQGEKGLREILLADDGIASGGRGGPSREISASGPWIRVEIVPGLEIHAARGFRVPQSGPARKALEQAFQSGLREVRQTRRALMATAPKKKVAKKKVARKVARKRARTKRG